jgi:hypothetical protein
MKMNINNDYASLIKNADSFQKQLAIEFRENAALKQQLQSLQCGSSGAPGSSAPRTPQTPRTAAASPKTPNTAAPSPLTPKHPAYPKQTAASPGPSSKFTPVKRLFSTVSPAKPLSPLPLFDDDNFNDLTLSQASNISEDMPEPKPKKVKETLPKQDSEPTPNTTQNNPPKHTPEASAEVAEPSATPADSEAAQTLQEGKDDELNEKEAMKLLE